MASEPNGHWAVESHFPRQQVSKRQEKQSKQKEEQIKREEKQMKQKERQIKSEEKKET